MAKLPYTLRAVDPKEIAIGTFNPRTINEKSPDFQELLASVKAVGVQSPICIRNQGGTYQLLAGERRLRAARLAELSAVPVLDYGEISDEVAFEVTFNENFRREDLTPLEAGRAVSMLLDRYAEDVAAVAAKLGETRHWVQTHAQIDRGLIPLWKTTAAEVANWTAAHWVEIARLPAAHQEKLHKRLLGSYRALDRYTSEDVAREGTADKRLLAEAPFSTEKCLAECEKRTGYCPLLWGEPSDDKDVEDRCLDPKCWDRKVANHARKQFKAKAAEKEIEAAPLCLLKEPKDYYKRLKYHKQLSALKKIYGTKLLTTDNVEIVKKDTKGAVPAIVVAGTGENAVRWVKPKPQEKKPEPNSNADTEQEESRRWTIVEDAIVTQIRAMELPDLAVTAVLARAVMESIWGDDIKRLFAETASCATFASRAEYARNALWQDFLDDITYGLNVEYDLFQPLCDLLGIEVDCQKMYDEIGADETGGEPPKDAKKPKGVACVDA